MNQLPTESANRAKGSRPRRHFDRLILPLFILGVAVACYVGGAYMAEFKVPVYKATLKPSFDGLRAARAKRNAEQMSAGEWYRAREKGVGVRSHQAELACEGYTLYTSLADSAEARLISMDGTLVHQWRLPFREAWPEPTHVARPVPDKHIHWRCVRMFPNGDLLADYVTPADTPHGYGMVKVDKDSRVIWRYSERVHHDFDIDREGRIYVLTHALSDEPVEAAPHLKTPMIEDFVVVLSPEGSELRRIPIFDAFAKSKFRQHLAAMKSDPKGDHTHANKVVVIPQGFARHHDFCSAGDLLISLRNPDTLAILNIERQEIVWAARGIWERQHDPIALENGNIVLFDNKGNKGPGGTSRVLEWNPASGAIEWSYTGTSDLPLESGVRGFQQPLPNGNMLITESNNGRLLEVSREGQVVWEFLNPDRRKARIEQVAVVCSALRYRPDEADFLKTKRLAAKPKPGSGRVAGASANR